MVSSIAPRSFGAPLPQDGPKPPSFFLEQLVACLKDLFAKEENGEITFLIDQPIDRSHIESALYEAFKDQFAVAHLNSCICQAFMPRGEFLFLVTNPANKTQRVDIYFIPNVIQNLALDKEAPQNLCLERMTIAGPQGMSENNDFGEKPTLSQRQVLNYVGYKQEEQKNFVSLEEPEQRRTPSPVPEEKIELIRSAKKKRKDVLRLYEEQIGSTDLLEKAIEQLPFLQKIYPQPKEYVAHVLNRLCLKLLQERQFNRLFSVVRPEYLPFLDREVVLAYCEDKLHQDVPLVAELIARLLDERREDCAPFLKLFFTTCHALPMFSASVEEAVCKVLSCSFKGVPLLGVGGDLCALQIFQEGSDRSKELLRSSLLAAIEKDVHGQLKPLVFALFQSPYFSKIDLSQRALFLEKTRAQYKAYRDEMAYALFFYFDQLEIGEESVDLILEYINAKAPPNGKHFAALRSKLAERLLPVLGKMGTVPLASKQMRPFLCEKSQAQLGKLLSPPVATSSAPILPKVEKKAPQPQVKLKIADLPNLIVRGEKSKEEALTALKQWKAIEEPEIWIHSFERSIWALDRMKLLSPEDKSKACIEVAIEILARAGKGNRLGYLELVARLLFLFKNWEISAGFFAADQLTKEEIELFLKSKYFDKNIAPFALPFLELSWRRMLDLLDHTLCFSLIQVVLDHNSDLPQSLLEFFASVRESILDLLIDCTSKKVKTEKELDYQAHFIYFFTKARQYLIRDPCPKFAIFQNQLVRFLNDEKQSDRNPSDLEFIHPLGWLVKWLPPSKDDTLTAENRKIRDEIALSYYVPVLSYIWRKFEDKKSSISIEEAGYAKLLTSTFPKLFPPAELEAVFAIHTALYIQCKDCVSRRLEMQSLIHALGKCSSSWKKNPIFISTILPIVLGEIGPIFRALIDLIRAEALGGISQFEDFKTHMSWFIRNCLQVRIDFTKIQMFKGDADEQLMAVNGFTEIFGAVAFEFSYELMNQLFVALPLLGPRGAKGIVLEEIVPSYQKEVTCLGIISYVSGLSQSLELSPTQFRRLFRLFPKIASVLQKMLTSAEPVEAIHSHLLYAVVSWVERGINRRNFKNIKENVYLLLTTVLEINAPIKGTYFYSQHSMRNGKKILGSGFHAIREKIKDKGIWDEKLEGLYLKACEGGIKHIFQILEDPSLDGASLGEILFAIQSSYRSSPPPEDLEQIRPVGNLLYSKALSALEAALEGPNEAPALEGCVQIVNFVDFFHKAIVVDDRFPDQILRFAKRHYAEHLTYVASWILKWVSPDQLLTEEQMENRDLVFTIVADTAMAVFWGHNHCIPQIIKAWSSNLKEIIIQYPKVCPQNGIIAVLSKFIQAHEEMDQGELSHAEKEPLRCQALLECARSITAVIKEGKEEELIGLKSGSVAVLFRLFAYFHLDGIEKEACLKGAMSLIEACLEKNLIQSWKDLFIKDLQFLNTAGEVQAPLLQAQMVIFRLSRIVGREWYIGTEGQEERAAAFIKGFPFEKMASQLSLTTVSLQADPEYALDPIVLGIHFSSLNLPNATFMKDHGRFQKGVERFAQEINQQPSLRKDLKWILIELIEQLNPKKPSKKIKDFKKNYVAIVQLVLLFKTALSKEHFEALVQEVGQDPILKQLDRAKESLGSLFPEELGDVIAQYRAL
jgi:hypothetical protein